MKPISILTQYITYGLLILALGIYIGRNYADAPSQTTTTSTDTTKQNQTTIVKTKSPTGEIKTVITSNTTTKTQEQKQLKDLNNAPRANISLLGAYIEGRQQPFQLGLSVSKQVYGPITIGVFVLNTGIVGVSTGFNF